MHEHAAELGMFGPIRFVFCFFFLLDLQMLSRVPTSGVCVSLVNRYCLPRILLVAGCFVDSLGWLRRFQLFKKLTQTNDNLVLTFCGKWC